MSFSLSKELIYVTSLHLDWLSEMRNRKNSQHGTKMLLNTYHVSTPRSKLETYVNVIIEQLKSSVIEFLDTFKGIQAQKDSIVSKISIVCICLP